MKTSHFSYNSPIAINVLQQTQEKIQVKRSDLINDIRNNILIVKDWEEIDAIRKLSWDRAIIPYYVVGINEQQEEELRSFFAEMIFCSAFELSYRGYEGNRSIAGAAIARLPKKSEKLVEWERLTERFSAAERDFISEFANPIQVVSGIGICAWGIGAYVRGQWIENILTVSWIHQQLGFDESTHVIIYDESN